MPVFSSEAFLNFTWVWIIVALLLVPIQLFISAPYGRHARKGWGPMISNRLGWMLMEIVSPAVFSYLFLSGPTEKTLPMWLFFALWNLHYLNRTFIFPLRTRTTGKKMPISIVLSAAFFNVFNGGLNGYWLGYLSPSYEIEWMTSWPFIIGGCLFVIGAYTNLRADNMLINLRKPGETGYKIPKGFLFDKISCPNHFGEVIEWTGFALMCWNLPALSFAIWTAANLIPRAMAHHKWYQEKFVDYPPERRAVIPYLF